MPGSFFGTPGKRLSDYTPLTVTGKIQKFRMREIAVEELGLQQEIRVETA